eukprot:2538276-Amphidinium_carterae.1
MASWGGAAVHKVCQSEPRAELGQSENQCVARVEEDSSSCAIELSAGHDTLLAACGGYALCNCGRSPSPSCASSRQLLGSQPAGGASHTTVDVELLQQLGWAHL